ncbi:isochorismatase family protein [Deinococcus fonticola]|uniref:isochorismatase family protein n=1 Tax=Deinococcus fonticola TaxID=2528713 RepID=UPI0014301F13|nr:isochorismatase family protein [Deinococcus fonticola]
MKKDRSKKGLLVVDVQNDVVQSAYQRDTVVGHIARLVAEARQQDVPVVWVQHHDDWMKKDTDAWQIVPELQPRVGEPVIQKAFGDSFAETNLEAELEKLDVGELILCGAQSDACITATLYGSLYRGYPVTLVQDAHTTENGEFNGQDYPAERIVNWVNRNAAYTRLPGIGSRLTTTAEAFNEK